MSAPRSDPSWTDTHCHLQDLEDYPAALKRASALRVHRLICVGTGAQSSRQAIEIAAGLAGRTEGPLVWASVGLHPHEASEGTGEVAEILKGAPLGVPGETKPPGTVVAVGECGLDYFYEHSPRDHQRVAFRAQIELAKRHDLALIVHTRDAWEDTLSVFASEGAPERTIIHCFSGTKAEAEAVLGLGCYVSLSGIVTFKNAQGLREVATSCPIERLLVETDSPFLAPVPHRGKPNEPGYVSVVGEAVAALRHEEPADLATVTSANAARVFALAV